jgi:phage/plasmid-associated DNA primase
MVLFGYTEIIDNQLKLFVCSNHLSKIGKDEDAVFNRYKQIQMCSHFNRSGDREAEDFEKLEFIADPELSDKLMKDCLDEIIFLALDFAARYYRQGIPPVPIEFLQASANAKLKNNDFAVWFWNNFEKGSDNLAIDEIMNTPYKILT